MYKIKRATDILYFKLFNIQDEELCKVVLILCIGLGLDMSNYCDKIGF